MSRASACWRALLLLVVAVAAAPSADERQRHEKEGDDAPGAPNIILIVADDLGYNDLGCFGSPTIRTPAIDRLAREGQKLTQFYVAAPLCTPSRASMLTGRLPVRSGTYTALQPPADDFLRVFYPSSEGCTLTSEVTIAAALQQQHHHQANDSGGEAASGSKGGGGGNGGGNGGGAPHYRTALIGKWHMGHNAEKGCLPGEGRRGFDSFLGLPYSHEEGYPGPAPEGVIWPPVPLFANASFVEQPFNGTDLTQRYTDAAVAFVGDASGGSNDGESGDADRFFLHLAYEAPHVPLFTAPSFEGVSRRGTYGDAVQEMDASVGEVMEAVRALDGRENKRKNKNNNEDGNRGGTLVLFTSDNGAWVGANTGLENPYLNSKSGIGPFDGGSNAPFTGGKGSTWEGGVRVPCIVWWPGVVPAASVSMAPMSGLDLFPTFLSLANRGGKQQAIATDISKGGGGSSGPVLDGFDVSKVWTDPESEPYGPWYDRFMFFWRESKVYAARHGRFKVHWATRSGFNTSDTGTRHSPPLVFDVESDPAESIPLTEDMYPELPALIAKSDAALERHLRVEVGDPLPSPPQYGPQDWSLVPCCDRGSFDPRDAVAAARAGEWGLAIWDECVCARE